jgi:hypothetical protein
MRDLGDELACVQRLDAARDVGAVLARLFWGTGAREDVNPHAGICESEGNMFALIEGLKEIEILRRSWVEAGDACALSVNGLCKLMKELMTGAWGMDDCKGIQIPRVGHKANLSVSVEVGDSLGHSQELFRTPCFFSTPRLPCPSVQLSPKITSDPGQPRKTGRSDFVLSLPTATAFGCGQGPP